MRLVTERIAATKDRVVLESELKVVLGFSGKRGHRTWRRLKVPGGTAGVMGSRVWGVRAQRENISGSW